MEGLVGEAGLSAQSLSLALAKARIRKFLESGGQTYEMELGWTNMVKVLSELG
jgi:hypothetical protein